MSGHSHAKDIMHRPLKAGSGTPSWAATVISRASLEKTFERTTSLLPFVAPLRVGGVLAEVVQDFR